MLAFELRLRALIACCLVFALLAAPCARAGSRLRAPASIGDLSTGITPSHRLMGNPAAFALPLATDTEALGLVARGSDGLEALRFYARHRSSVKDYLETGANDPGLPTSDPMRADFGEAELTIFSALRSGYGVAVGYRATRLLQTDPALGIRSGYDNRLGVELGHGRRIGLPIPGTLAYGVGLWLHARQGGVGVATAAGEFEQLVERRALLPWSEQDRTHLFTGTRLSGLWSVQPPVRLLGPVALGAAIEDPLGGHLDGRWSALSRGGASVGFRTPWLPRLSLSYGSWRSETPGFSDDAQAFYRVEEGLAASLAWEPSILRVAAGYSPSSLDFALELVGPGARLGYALSLYRDETSWAGEGDLQHAAMFAFGSVPGPRFGEVAR